jgi:SPW repeat
MIIAVAAFAALAAFQKWEEWINAALGAWLIVSPFILGFSAISAALWNQLGVGLVVLVLAAWAAMAETEGTIPA